jgi:hypothetical protein
MNRLGHCESLQLFEAVERPARSAFSMASRSDSPEHSKSGVFSALLRSSRKIQLSNVCVSREFHLGGTWPRLWPNAPGRCEKRSQFPASDSLAKSIDWMKCPPEYSCPALIHIGFSLKNILSHKMKSLSVLIAAASMASLSQV